MGDPPGRGGNPGAFSFDEVDKSLERPMEQEFGGSREPFSSLGCPLLVAGSADPGPPVTGRDFRGAGGTGRGFSTTCCVEARDVLGGCMVGFRRIDKSRVGPASSQRERRPIELILVATLSIELGLDAFTSCTLL